MLRFRAPRVPSAHPTIVQRSLAEIRRGVREELAHGRAMLFMGAGFSSGATDVDGRPIPLGDALAEELFALCYPGEEYDGSALQDLFHHALFHHRDELDRLLHRRLVVSGDLPRWYRAWFSQPWSRAYTLNVDVIERAAARTFALDRDIMSISALRDRDPELPADALAVVHLNGIVDDGCDRVTFATSQYGRRLASRDRWYTRLVQDLVEASFVFVGTRLDEAPLWQHLEGREVAKRRQENGDAPRSVLVATRIDRARRSLLEDFDIDWTCASAEDFAREVLGAR